MVRAARKAGAKVTFSLERKERMPLRLPGDHEHVTMLLDESERLTEYGNRWLTCEKPNQIAAEFSLRNGWAMAAAAAWLRCKLKGEVK